jgi:hypothetical protein
VVYFSFGKSSKEIYQELEAQESSEEEVRTECYCIKELQALKFFGDQSFDWYFGYCFLVG